MMTLLTVFVSVVPRDGLDWFGEDLLIHALQHQFVLVLRYQSIAVPVVAHKRLQVSCIRRVHKICQYLYMYMYMYMCEMHN